MAGSHVVLVDPKLDADIRAASQQIAGLIEILSAGRQFLAERNLGPDFSGGVIAFMPKAHGGYLAPAPIASVVMLHVRVDPAYATIIGLWLTERQQGWGIPPTGAPPLPVS